MSTGRYWNEINQLWTERNWNITEFRQHKGRSAMYKGMVYVIDRININNTFLPPMTTRSNGKTYLYLVLLSHISWD